MDSLDAFIYNDVWKYCRRKNRKAGAKKVYQKYTLPHPLRQVGHFQLGVVVGEQAVQIPRLSSIPQKPLKLPYPPHPYLQDERDYVLPYPGTSDELWWDRPIWVEQEGAREGQRRLAAEVLARAITCQMCGKPAKKRKTSPKRIRPCRSIWP